MKHVAVPILLLLVFLCQAAHGQEVKFRVRVMLASRQGTLIDPQLSESIGKYLKKSFGTRYTSFRQLDNRVVRLRLDETGEVALPDQTSLKLRFRDIQGEFIKLTMEIKDLRTTIRIKNGGLFFQAGHRYKNGILILAVTANLIGVEDSSENPSEARPEPRPENPAASTPARPIERKAVPIRPFRGPIPTVPVVNPPDEPEKRPAPTGTQPAPTGTAPTPAPAFLAAPPAGQPTPTPAPVSAPKAESPTAPTH